MVLKKRKRKQQKNNSKIIKIFVVIFACIILILVSVILYINLKNKKEENKNEIKEICSDVFSIDKIYFYSNCDVAKKNVVSNGLILDNLYTYTDIAIYINNGNDLLDEEHTLKNVSINNIKFIKSPILGKINLYFKSINDFGKSENDEKNLILNEINYDVISEDIGDLSKPKLYNNCSNPITFSYVINNIKNQYSIENKDEFIMYNGSLLKNCDISLDSISTQMSFDVCIENNKKEKFKATVDFEIPYSNENESIYDGDIYVKKDCLFNFYKYE